MEWWQARCLEWCFNRAEDGKLGDQKYLDDWPERFAAEVHVLQQVEKTLAPWNVNLFTKKGVKQHKPVMYHFHGLRIIEPTKVWLHPDGYRIGKKGMQLYDHYMHVLRKAVNIMRRNGLPVPIMAPARKYRWFELRALILSWLGRIHVASL